MEKKEETSYWLKFFRDAGIPTKTGASYSHVFVENRMHKDMLLELSADYLRLMGITLMGDIIAILRHAKSVHQDSLRKVVILQSKKEPSSESSSSSGSSSSSSSDSSSDEEDVKMVEITKPVAKKALGSKLVKPKAIVTVKKEAFPQNKIIQLKSQVINKLLTTNSKADENKQEKPAPPNKRKFVNDEHDVEMVDVSPTKTVAPSSASSSRSILRTANSSTKKIRLASDNDLMGPKLPPPKKTVFDRLGAETEPPQVSSTTAEIPKPEIETKFTRIISNVSLPPKLARTPPSLDTSKVGSVFERLGSLKEDEQSRVKHSAASLKYIGILKSPPTVAKTPLKLKRTGTMRADQPEVPLKLRAATTPVHPKAVTVASKRGVSTERKLLINRIGLIADQSPRVKLPKKESEGIFANPGKLNSSSNVKARLGVSTSSANRAMKKPSPIRFSDDKLERISGMRSRMRMDAKQVSFGIVEKKIISPRPTAVRSSGLNRRNNKSSVHSRLGPLN